MASVIAATQSPMPCRALAAYFLSRSLPFQGGRGRGFERHAARRRSGSPMQTGCMFRGGGWGQHSFDHTPFQCQLHPIPTLSLPLKGRDLLSGAVPGLRSAKPRHPSNFKKPDSGKQPGRLVPRFPSGAAPCRLPSSFPPMPIVLGPGCAPAAQRRFAHRTACSRPDAFAWLPGTAPPSHSGGEVWAGRPCLRRNAASADTTLHESSSS